METKYILWGIKYNTYNAAKNEVSQSIRAMGYTVSETEKYSKNAILNELKNKEYDYLFLSESLEEKKYSVKDLEEIIETRPYLRVVYIINKDNAEVEYLNGLISLGESIFSHIIHIDDFNVDKVMSVLKKPRTRVEAKLYLDIDSTNKNKATATFDKNIIATIILNIQKITNNEEKILAFRSYIEKYTTEQVLEILTYFPSELLDLFKDEQIVNAYINSRKSGGPVKIKVQQEPTGVPAAAQASASTPAPEPKEKLIIKETILVNTTSNVSLFSKKVYTIIDNPEMGVDMAMILSKDYKTLLIDFDPLGPSLHHEIGIDIFDNNNITGLHKLLLLNNKENVEAFRKQCLQYDNNLDICTTKYEPALQRKFTAEDLQTLLDTAYSAYDIVILLCSNFCLNIFNQVAVKRSSNVIISVEPYKNRIERTLTQTYSIFEQNSVLSHKINVVIYNCDQPGAISVVKARASIKEFGFNFWGTIPVSEGKIQNRNKDKYYFPDKSMLDAYREILSKENIHLRKSTFENIKKMFSKNKKEKKKVIINGDFFDTFK